MSHPESRGTPPGSQNPERDERVFAMKQAGMSYGEIAKVFSLSRARIAQIVQRERRQRDGR